MAGAGSLSLPFSVAGSLSLLIYLILPESFPIESRAQAIKIDLKSRFVGMWQGLKGPLAVFLLLSFLVSFDTEGVFGLFALERFGFGPYQVGIVMMVTGTVVAGIQMLLTGPATRKRGERTVIKASLLGLTGSSLLILAAFDLPPLMLTTGLFAFTNAVLRPSISYLVFKETEMDQGLALGLNSSFMSIGRFVGPLLAGFLIYIRVCLPYLAGSLIMDAGFFVRASLPGAGARRSLAVKS